MAYSDTARGVVGALSMAVAAPLLRYLTGCPPIIAFVGGAIIGAFAMIADLIWVAFCACFWPPRLE
jgi:hypothetical protein